MPNYRRITPEIRYGAGYATVLGFRFMLDAADGYSEPRVEALIRANAPGTRVVSASYGHDQRLMGTVRRIPRADITVGGLTVSGWPAWRAFFRYAWTLQPWRWVYQAGAYSAGDASTYFDAELEEPKMDWEEGPDLEANGQRRPELVIVRKNGALDTGAAVEGY